MGIRQLKIGFIASMLSMGTMLTSCLPEQVEQVLSDGGYLQLGLQSLLKVSTDTSVKKLSALNGYFGDALVKVLLPPDAQQLATALRTLGQEQLVNDLVLRLNRAAETAATRATPIFVNSITNITFNDALGIVNGTVDTAATNYLRRTTTQPLVNAFRPEVQAVLGQPLVGNLSAADSWREVIGLYDQVRNSPANILLNLQPINSDLSTYVTERALHGLFIKIRGHEQRIRADLNMRVTPEIRRLWQR